MADEPSKDLEETSTTKSITEPDSKPTVIMTEIDSKIHERMRSQPQARDEIDVKVARKEFTGLHRMSLPPALESESYDCTRGDTCDFHKRERVKVRMGEDKYVWHVNILNHGRYVFRWVMKNDRAIDYAMNVRGWYLVNRDYFPDVPRVHFSASGAIEMGDSILAFMPLEKALEIRSAPGNRSKEMLNSRITPSRRNPKRALMTGDPESEHVYEPNLAADEANTGPGSAGQPGSIQEGRDF